MDVLASVSLNTGNVIGAVPSSPNPGCGFNEAFAEKTGHGAGGPMVYQEVHFDTKIVRAVKKWSACDNVRIEFYAAREGDIRVKIIKNGNGGKTCDVSLATFMRSSPATI
jgi:hypothetical protein